MVEAEKTVKIGVIFPQTEITEDPIAVRDYAQATEDLGYSHILAYDHVIGADPSARPAWKGPYTHHSLFHEPFVLFGYLAGLTRQIEFVTGIVILPQRQTVLVAKQAAEVDVLTGGRLRLGVGLGWNDVEYQALNENFRNRARRIEEQVSLLRKLFSQEVVTLHGRWHHVEAAGINPLPVQRPIPIWLGGATDATLRRVAALGDGWFPQMPPDEATPMIEQLRQYARDAGRDPSSIGIEARLSLARVREEEWGPTIEMWQRLGVTHLGINSMGGGLSGPQQHLDTLRRFREVVSGIPQTP